MTLRSLLSLSLILSAFLCSCKDKENAAPAATETPVETAKVSTEKAAEAPTLSAELQALISAAEGGDAVAQNNLAMAYAAGEGVPADLAKAVELYQAAAEQGSAVARFNLARCYALGEGVPVDEKKFVELCTDAAYAGFAPAQYTLGCAYRDGLGVAVNPDEAERWLSRAEMNGYAPAKAAWQELKAQKK